jgi:hypothetical protein
VNLGEYTNSESLSLQPRRLCGKKYLQPITNGDLYAISKKNIQIYTKNYHITHPDMNLHILYNNILNNNANIKDEEWSLLGYYVVWLS